MPAMLLWSPEVRLGWMNVAAPRDLIAPESLKLADLSPSSAGPRIEFDPRVFEAQEVRLECAARAGPGPVPRLAAASNAGNGPTGRRQ